MDRHVHPRYRPQCPRQAAIVDQYMWKDKDTTYYKCYNGISHPIYDCKGMINYSLPLEHYPPAGRIHPQIEMTRRMHMNYRGNPHKFYPIQERFTYAPKTGLHIVSDRTPGYPLPNPYGNNRGCNACNRC